MTCMIPRLEREELERKIRSSETLGRVFSFAFLAVYFLTPFIVLTIGFIGFIAVIMMSLMLISAEIIFETRYWAYVILYEMRYGSKKKGK